jgi:hypothetical protein
MKLKYFVWSVALAIVFLQAFVPGASMALDLIVEQNPASSSGHYGSIQAALDHASSLLSQPTNTLAFSVVVEPGTYGGPITPISNVPIQGRETARVIITGGSTGALFTISNVTNITIKNLTIINSGIGISVSNSSQILISANVFQVGTSGIAVQVQNSPTTSIINNTFYQNGTAITTGSDILITNNIFSTNGMAISSQGVMTQITYNDYNNNTSNGNITLDTHSIPNSTTTFTTDPLFVNTTKRDFHLQENSPCHMFSGTDAGNPNYPNAVDSATFDMGAYGGLHSDTIPFILSGVKVVFSPPDSATVSWSPNNSYVVTNTNTALQGGYNVYYSLNKSEPPYDNKATLASTATSTIINGLITSVPPPAAPVLNEPGYLSETLLLSWSPVPTATSYNIHYTDLVTSVTNTISGVKTTAYALTGLVNGRDYTVTVSAVAQPVYYFSVTAFDYTVVSSSGGTPGEKNESAYTSPPVPLNNFGTPSESLPSNPRTAYPEAIIPNPDLPNKGCFIATAAYGYYSAPQVQALRMFRDEYLETNAPGRAFVSWYYRYGPIGAEFINAHPWTKPLVRIALMPAVGVALFMTRASFLVKLLIMMLCLISITAYTIRRKKQFRAGGVR